MFRAKKRSRAPSTYSNAWACGQQQRIAFARALIHEPRLIVCDEPTSALDAETGQAVMELLTDIAVRPDRAVVIVTHDDRIFRFADVIAAMSDGSVVKVTREKPRRLASDPDLEPAFRESALQTSNQ
jgi:putative ABC transport system ATP-binding protein